MGEGRGEGLSASLKTLRLTATRWIAAIFLLAPLLALAQNDKQVWVQRFGSTFGSKDLASSIARDPAGNVIVAGTSDEGGLGLGMVVVKYSAARVPLWVSRYNTPGDERVSGVAVDGSGNVFVAGVSGPRGVTLAFSSAGVGLWTNVFDGEGQGVSAPAVDASGNVFVTGLLQGAVSFGMFKYSGAGVPLWTNILVASANLKAYYAPTTLVMDSAGNVVARVGKYIVKYANNGAALWTNGCPGANELDRPRALALDGAGNVFLLGQNPGGAGGLPNNLLVKYSSAGTILWTNKFADGSGQSLAVDSAGNVAVAISFGNSYPYGMRTIKYAPDGTLMWLNEFSDYWAQDFSYPPSLTAATDGNGNVFVSGYCIHGEDHVTIKYSAQGSAFWTNRWYVPRDENEINDRPYPALTIDPGGNALLAGYFFNQFNTDFATRKYTSDGTAAWTTLYDGTGPSDSDYPNALAVDSVGNIIVAGGGHHDYVTLKYSPSGIPLWTNYFDGAAHVWDIATALAVASNGNIFVTGKSFPGTYEDVTGFWLTLAYTADGVPLWTNDCQSFETPVAIAADGNGDVIVSGDAENFWGYGGWVTIKYSGAGVPLWTNTHAGTGWDSSGWLHGLAVDPLGNAIVVGSTTHSDDQEDSTVFEFTAIKYSSSGSALWTNLFSRGGYGEAIAVAAWTNGDIFVTGHEQPINSGSSDIVTIKYSAAGLPLWTNLYDGPAQLGDFSRALALDGAGNVIVTGDSATASGAEIVTIKYSNAGTALWTNRYAGPPSAASHAVAVDGNGNVFVTGASGSDSITIAYSSGGVPLWTNRYYGPLGHADEGLAIAVTGVGQVVVLGASSGDFATVKYDSGFLPDTPSQPGFTNVTAMLAPGLLAGCSTLAWGDYDNDGRLDLFVGGYTYGDGDDIWYAQLWRNTANGFTNVTATVAPDSTGAGGSAAWGDFDNDGRLDLIFTGQVALELETTQIWRNTGTGFVNVTVPGVTSLESSSVAWGDYDNDGRLDFLIMGFRYNENENIVEVPTQLWRNTGSGFTNVTATVAPGLPQVDSGSVAWADYDNDGRLDFLITGTEFFSGSPVSQLWRNTETGFINVTATVAPGLPQVTASSVAWGDYDNDGRLDFLIAGFSQSGVFHSQLWRNTGARFTNAVAAFAPGLTASDPISSSVAWGDYNNDGRLDFLLSGHCYPNGGTGSVSQIWQNTGTGFTNVTESAGLPLFSSAAWVDFDNDGRLDLACTEYPWGAPQLWRNNTPITNTPPSAPTGLAMTASSNAVMLSWNSATDDHTPASGLTYNVRAGTTPGGNDLLSAHVNATNGFRRVPAMGNAMLRHNLPLTGLTNGQTVYWSVQAVDSAFAGGPFATETSVVSLPQLHITQSDPTNAVISWTPPTFGWVLQQSPTLRASNWTSTASGSANPATLPATNGTQFYRLSKP